VPEQHFGALWGISGQYFVMVFWEALGSSRAAFRGLLGQHAVCFGIFQASQWFWIFGVFWGCVLGYFEAFWSAALGQLSGRQDLGITTHRPPPRRVWDALTDGFTPQGSPRPWLLPGAEAPDGTDPQVRLWPSPLAPPNPLSPHDPLVMLDSCQSAPRLSDHQSTADYPKIIFLGCCGSNAADVHILG